MSEIALSPIERRVIGWSLDVGGVPGGGFLPS